MFQEEDDPVRSTDQDIYGEKEVGSEGESAKEKACDRECASMAV